MVKLTEHEKCNNKPQRVISGTLKVQGKYNVETDVFI